MAKKPRSWEHANDLAGIIALGQDWLPVLSFEEAFGDDVEDRQACSASFRGI